MADLAEGEARVRAVFARAFPHEYFAVRDQERTDLIARAILRQIGPRAAPPDVEELIVVSPRHPAP